MFLGRRQEFLPKRGYIYTRLHGVTSQKTVTLIVTVVRTHVSRTGSEVIDDSKRLKRHCSLKLISNSMVQYVYKWLLIWPGKLRKAILASSCLSVRSVRPSFRKKQTVSFDVFLTVHRR